MSIRNVSDTARWVAWYRAEESDRPDALFHDPFARRLAGARGAEIIRTLPGARRLGWVMTVRTCVFDELILRAIRQDGVDTVVNLACGFDARPYRLALPSSLRWFEVDLPPLIEEKRGALAGERPICRLESVALDLADPAGRGDLFRRIGSGSQRVLVLTEGLLAYLEPAAVFDLAKALHVEPTFAQWITDLASPFILKKYMRRASARLAAANAPFRFAPEEGEEFFRPAGWSPAEFRLTGEEGQRLGREVKLAWLWRFMFRFMSPERKAEMARRYRAGTVLLRRV
jgi:methyltransferase (TIGR00027 family)